MPRSSYYGYDDEDDYEIVNPRAPLDPNYEYYVETVRRKGSPGRYRPRTSSYNPR
jgi:hypothetical protein